MSRVIEIILVILIRYRLIGILATATMFLSACGGGVNSAAGTDSLAPSAPANFTATAGSTTSINLSWAAATDNVGVTGYKVYSGATKIASIVTTSYRLSGLTSGTQYCYIIKAFDAVGNLSSTSNQSCATTLTSVIYAGKEYQVVKIGSQTWLQENLDVGIMIQGSTNAGNNGTIEKYCYDDNSANCAIYGGLYQWNEAMMYSTTLGAQGICPVGWHIPTPTEFQTLSSTAGNDPLTYMAGGQANGINSNDFSAPLAGFCFPPVTNSVTGSHFDKLQVGTSYWSSSVIITDAYYWSPGIVNAASDKRYGFSIRCLKD